MDHLLILRKDRSTPVLSTALEICHAGDMTDTALTVLLQEPSQKFNLARITHAPFAAIKPLLAGDTTMMVKLAGCLLGTRSHLYLSVNDTAAEF